MEVPSEMTLAQFVSKLQQPTIVCINGSNKQGGSSVNGKLLANGVLTGPFHRLTRIAHSLCERHSRCRYVA